MSYRTVIYFLFDQVPRRSDCIHCIWYQHDNVFQYCSRGRKRQSSVHILVIRTFELSKEEKQKLWFSNSTNFNKTSNQQLPCSTEHKKWEKTYHVLNLGPDLGQAQTCGGVKPFNGTPNPWNVEFVRRYREMCSYILH